MCSRIQPAALAVLLLWGGGTGQAADSRYTISTIAGSDLVGDGGPAVAAQLSQPEGVALDRAGNLYIADAANHRVRKVTPGGLISTVAGNGQAGFGGDGGPAERSQLNAPYGLVCDSGGNLYIADFGNQRVRRISAAGQITTLAGTGEPGSSGDGGLGASARLDGPRNLALDASGNLYISEFEGHRVRKLDSGGVITTVAGTGVAGFSGDGGPGPLAQLGAPAGLAVDAGGALFIADTLNHRVRKLAGGLLSTVFFPQKVGRASLQLSGLATDAAGNLLLTESFEGLLWLLTPAGVAARLNATALDTPRDVTVDSAGGVFIAERHRVRKLPAGGGAISTVAGDGSFGLRGDGGPALSATLNAPVGLALVSGDLYVSDQGNQRIRKINAAGTISTVASVVQLVNPSGLAADPSGNLYIADTDHHQVLELSSAGQILRVAGSGSNTGLGVEGGRALSMPLDRPRGLAADAAGNLLIADSGHGRILRVDPAGGARTLAGREAELQQPVALAQDRGGNVYIADAAGHRIRKLSVSGAVSTVAGTGVSGFSGDGGDALNAQLSFPCALALDAEQNLYIADSGNHRVRKLSPEGRIVTIAGTGTAGFSGDDKPALQAALRNPCGLAVDASGAIFVADTANNRIRKLSPMLEAVPPAPIEVPVTIVNAASLRAGPVAPGELIRIFGDALDGAQLQFDQTPAPLVSSQPTQITAQVPYEVAGREATQLDILAGGHSRFSASLAVVPAAPAIFDAAILNQDGTLNADINPAARGSTVTLFATGEGQTDPPGATGTPADTPSARPLLPVSLSMGGNAAEILYAGNAPGFIGLMQINARVPAGFVTPGLLPVTLTVGIYTSPDGPKIAVR